MNNTDSYLYNNIFSCLYWTEIKKGIFQRAKHCGRLFWTFQSIGYYLVLIPDKKYIYKILHKKKLEKNHETVNTIINYENS